MRPLSPNLRLDPLPPGWARFLPFPRRSNRARIIDKQLNLTVCGKDILRIGHTWFNDGGRLSVIARAETAGVESILLRNIFRYFGDGYLITGEEDYECGNGDMDVLLRTSLPYVLFEEAALD